MKPLFIYSLLAAMLLLTGCPYSSDTPVDPGSFSVPAWLTGKWQEVKSDGNGTVYELKPDKGNSSILTATVPGEKEKKVYMSKVGSSVYMSVYEAGDDLSDEGYYIFRMTKKSNTEMELLPLKEHADVGSAASLKEFLRQHENDDAVFEKTELMQFKKI